MKVKLIANTPEPEKVIATAAKLCYSDKADIDSLSDSLTKDNVEKFIKHIIGVNHASVLEHASFTFAIEGVSRALLAEITRHRLASFSVRSQRYCSEEKSEHVTPNTIHKQGELAEEIYDDIMEASTEIYAELCTLGVPKEDARMVLPNATHTRMIVTMNVRELLHFFNLRCCSRAQWEIRSLANEMLKICKEVSPILFEKGGASCVNLGYCPEGSRCCGRAKTLEQILSNQKE